MKRREVLRLLATGTALQLAPANMLTLMREVRTLLADSAAPRSLNGHQSATVKAIAELILPRTDTPGASDVGAVEFIDLILTEWCDDHERTQFLKGVDDVDSRAQKIFGKDFIDCLPMRQSEILIALGEEMLQDERAQETTGGAEAPHEPNFYSALRRLTLTAYYTSEAGATQELHFEVIPDRYQGCDTMPANQEGPKQP